jgi:hypothetical protein
VLKNSILNDPIYAQVMLATEDETTFSESKEVLESLCYEGTVLVSSRAVAASAFSILLFFFFERLDIPLNYFSLFWRGKIREKGLFYFCRAHLFPAPGDVLEKVQRPSNARKKTSRDVFFLVRAVFG